MTDELKKLVAWNLYAIMDGERLSKIFAKNPNRPEVVDVTEDIARLTAAMPEPPA